MSKTMKFFIFLIRIYIFASLVIDIKKECADLNCDFDEKVKNTSVCGIRIEGQGYRLREFDNECELLKFGCSVSSNEAYGIINKEYCDETFDPQKPEDITYESLEIEPSIQETLQEQNQPCSLINCSSKTDEEWVCGIKRDGLGFKVRLFENNCELLKHNCENEDDFLKTYIMDCRDLTDQNITISEFLKNDDNETVVSAQARNLIIINGPPTSLHRSINDSINDFFASTHAFRLPLRRVALETKITDETRRNMLIKIAGPQVIYEPVGKHDKRYNDSEHEPFLETCFHSCPKKCPDHYSPVCGYPGQKAKEPVLTFKNHCFMDMTQCRMRKEDASPTAISSKYEENSFIFCVGESVFHMLRFLPVIRTLQHMGRFKQKGKFYYRFHNMRYMNELLAREGRSMG